jgi:hypothetical protein
MLSTMKIKIAAIAVSTAALLAALTAQAKLSAEELAKLTQNPVGNLISFLPRVINTSATTTGVPGSRELYCTLRRILLGSMGLCSISGYCLIPKMIMVKKQFVAFRPSEHCIFFRKRQEIIMRVRVWQDFL